MLVFSSSEQGHALHLRPTPTGRMTSKIQSELVFVGWFMFMLMLKGVRVTRPFIKATMAFACGCNPVSPDDPTLSSWDADFVAYKPAVDSAFKQLMVHDIDAQRSARDSVRVQDCPELAWGIMGLEPGPAFVEAIEALRKRTVHKWLFADCAVAGEALHSGFTFCIDNLAESHDLPLIQKKRILKTKEKFMVTPHFFEPVFGADMGIDVEDFLGTCTYVGIKAAVQTRFEACVRGLPMGELQNLLFFITDSRYFNYAPIRIIGKPLWSQEKLPTSATCFNTLYLPLYENEALMARKLSIATANCSGYGLM